jgi:hypothetical protein
MTLQIIIKIGLSIFLILWSLLGVWLVMNYNRLFGPHPDDPAETPGARSFGVAHIVAVWIGGMSLAVYFISR